MRIAIAALGLPLLALAACQVSKDDQNDTISATYNEEVAGNVAEDVGNFAEDVGNELQSTAQKVENEVGDVDVDVDVSRDGDKANANAN